MKFFKKFFAVITATVLACCMCAATVSAESIDKSAVSIQAGKTYSGKIESGTIIESGTVDNYKIKVSAKGKLILSFTSYLENAIIYVYDSNFKLQEPDEVNLTSGKWWSSNYSIDYDKNTEIAKGSETFNVKPGTYYIQIKGQYYRNTGKYKFSVSVPGEKASETVSNSSSTSIKLNMEVGDKINLSAMSSGKDVSSAQWTSSNSKIVKVSTKGKITALKAGSCTVTWKSGSTSFTVYIEVE